MDMLNVLIGILSLCGTCFAIGYQSGKDNRGNTCGENRRERSDNMQK